MSASGFVAHHGIRPVLTVDFNEQHEGGRMWARRGDWLLSAGQPVILTEEGGGNDGRPLDCDGHVVEVAPCGWEGKPCPEYVAVQIDEEPRWRDGSPPARPEES